MRTAHCAWWIDVVRRAAPFLLAAATLGSAHAVLATSGPSTLARWTGTPRLPVAGDYRYTLTARVRPLLVFWISRPNVGAARIVRGQAANSARSYELLIGSDPDKCPMRLNRWGYVAESTQDGTSRLVGLMTESNEESVEQATAALNQRPQGRHPFKAIRASVANGEASAQVVRVAFDEAFTLRDVEKVLGRLPEGGEPTARVAVPAGTSPGFLAALAQAIHAGAEAFRTSGVAARGRSQAFVYDRGFYDLTVKSSKVVPQVQLASKSLRNCIDSELEIRNRATGSTTEFRLVYATGGRLAEVPVRIVYRPRWYFEAELTLEAWQ
jgi:hypothetical protein